MTDLASLSPTALRAAMITGTEGWGQRGSVKDHSLYVEPIGGDKRRHRKCYCGCGRRATYGLFANGVALSNGCELEMHRLAKRKGFGR